MLLPDNGIMFLIKFMLPFFLIGYHCFKRREILEKYSGNYLLLFLLALLGGYCYSSWDRNTFIYISKMTLNETNVPIIIFRFFSSLIVSISISLFCFQIYKKLPFPTMNKIGSKSLYIYILQSYFFLGFTRCFKSIAIPGSKAWLSIFFAPLIAVVRKRPLAPYSLMKAFHI
jgi:hypothetical protein